MLAWSKLLLVRIDSRKGSIHIASPFLFYNLGFECVLMAEGIKKKLWFSFHLGTLYWMFFDGSWIEFFSRW
uniref:Uncharacterized protein n=1 Tax=viral metagenome TaxID=1070528 RepID=A0A6H1ZVC7_9ZZZZ